MEQLANVILRWVHPHDYDNDVAARPLERSSHRDSIEENNDYECHSEFCRYCNALEKSLLWQGCYTVFINVCILLLFSVVVWAYNGLGMPQMPFGIITVYFIIQMMVVYKVINTLAPAEQHPKVCSRLHSVWKRLGQLRNERREIYQLLICSVAFGLWVFGRISSSSSRNTIYWSIIFAPPVLRLPLKICEVITTYLRSHGDWRYDSDIEDEFLPVVTEANLQVLNRVGETGDRSPTPTLTSTLWDEFNGPLNDEDLVEGLNIPSHEEASTDGVELSELDLSVSENDAEENDIKFQSSHFEKSSSSSSEEEILDSNRINAVSSDESNGDSDFEIIDKEEVAKIKI